MDHSTVSLIGMPGAGKSTIGVLLAKLLGFNFIDSDLVIQVRHKATLQQILDREGHKHLRSLEEAVLLDINLQHCLLATGGSAVYSKAGMKRLADAGPVLFIDVPLDELMARIDNEADRGIARKPGQSFAEVYRERLPLYRRYADIRIEGDQQSAEATARLLAGQLRSASTP